jgi:hypothetical protein
LGRLWGALGLHAHTAHAWRSCTGTGLIVIVRFLFLFTFPYIFTFVVPKGYYVTFGLTGLFPLYLSYTFVNAQISCFNN